MAEKDGRMTEEYEWPEGMTVEQKLGVLAELNAEQAIDLLRHLPVEERMEVMFPDAEWIAHTTWDVHEEDE